MKISTTLQSALLAFATISASMIAYGCSDEKDPQPEGNHRPADGQQKMYSYRLSLGGDYVEETDELMVRAGESNSYVGINVTRRQPGSTASENYAYGVFTSKNDIQIDLAGGYTYDFEATVLTNGTDDLKIYNNAYRDPFRTLQDKIYTSDQNKFGFPTSSANKFIYNFSDIERPTQDWLCELGSGRAKVSLNHDTYEYPSCQYPRVHRYYGTLDGFNPDTAYGANIELELEYKSFGIRIDASEIPSGTQLYWKDVTSGRSDDADGVSQLLHFPVNLRLNPDSYDTRTWEDVYSLYNLKGDGTDSFTLRFSWNNGTAIETFDQTFQVRAKYKKVLKIVIDENSNTSSRGNIVIREEGNTLTDDNLTVTHGKQ